MYGRQLDNAHREASAVVEERLLVTEDALSAARVGALAAQVEAARLEELPEGEQIVDARLRGARRGEVEGERALSRHLPSMGGTWEVSSGQGA